VGWISHLSIHLATIRFIGIGRKAKT